MKFLKDFIQFYISQEKFQKNPNEFNIRSCVVFPNTRGGLFFQKYLTEKFSNNHNPYFLPAIMAWDDFVFHITGRVSVSQTSALLILYDLVKKNEEASYVFPSLQSFWPTGRKIYNDFRLVDSELVDTKKFFSESYESWRLSLWGKEMRSEENNFLLFCKSLGQIYQLFRERLLQDNLAYPELALRDMIENNRTITFPYEHIFFVGIIDSSSLYVKTLDFLRSKEINIYPFIDYDSYYLKDYHEAGKYYALATKNIQNFYKKENSDFEKTKNISLVGVPLGYNQVNYVINEISKKNCDELKDTVVVIADYDLVLPFLKAVPENLQKCINISMGFPLQNSRMFSFLYQCILLVKNMLSERAITKQHIENVLLHPMLINTSLMDFPSGENLKNIPYLIYPPYHEFEEFSKKVFNANYSFVKPAEFIQFFKEKIMNIFDADGKKTAMDEIDKLAFMELLNIMETLYSSLLRHGISETENIFYDILLEELRHATLPLAGSPLQDFQVLGPLETAVLDFKNVYIVGFNEGSWPPNMFAETFIPFELRNEYKLNKHYLKQYEYAYLFYRLLQHAENVHLVYNNVEDDLYGKEVSHYIHQLKYELIPWAKNNSIAYVLHEKNVEVSNFYIADLDENDKLKIPSEDKPKTLSFTSWYEYIDCPYRFALRYILKLKEPQKDELEIERNTFGSYVHKIFENLIGKEAKEKKDFQISWQELYNKYFAGKGEYIKAAEEEIFMGKNTQEYLKFEYAYNNLLKEMLHTAIDNFFEQIVKERGNSKVIKSEEKIQLVKEIDGEKLILEGVIDILEKNNEGYHILDFKTSSKNLDLTINKHGKLALPSSKNDLMKERYLFQLLFYAYLLYHNDYDQISCELALLLKNKNMLNKILYDDGNIFIYSPEFDEKFSILFEEEVLIPYIHEENWEATPKNCDYCPYQNICYAYKRG